MKPTMKVRCTDVLHDESKSPAVANHFVPTWGKKLGSAFEYKLIK
jgi:hypothetical protein